MARRGSGQGHAGEVPPLPCGPHPAPTAKARWRVNAAGARAAFSRLPPRFSRAAAFSLSPAAPRHGLRPPGRRPLGRAEWLAPGPARGFQACPRPAAGLRGPRSRLAAAAGGPGEERELGAEEGGRVGSQPRCGRGRAAFGKGSRRLGNFPGRVWR